MATQDCHFAIKGQGHAPSKEFANIDHGITVDLSGLDSVTVNLDASIASVGTGARWLDVYTLLDPLNKTVAGGRNGAVGVGGLTIGGGISYFSPQVGFTCDTVASFEVVLASGEIVNANNTSHSDLFRALKGGLNNFGVVTRIDFRTLPINEILGGNVVNDVEYRGEVFNAFAAIANAKEYDVHASIVTSLVFNSSSKAWTINSAPIYTEPDPNPPVYEELFAIPSKSNTMQLTQLHNLANEKVTPPTNILFYTGTYGVSVELLDQIFNICNGTLYDYDVPGSVEWLMTFEPLPVVLISYGADDNVLGNHPETGNGMVLLFTAIWADVGYSHSVDAKARQVLTNINAAAEDLGLSHDFIYANYAGRSQEPLQSYGAKNERFLGKVATQYDPERVFQRLVPGGFKLSS